MTSQVSKQSRNISVGRSATLSVDLLYPGNTEYDHKIPLILFVHGLGSSKTIWFETAEWICLRYGYTCILVDLRGHGKSVDAAFTEKSNDYSEHFFPGKTRSPDATIISSNSNYSLCRSADDLAIIIRTTFEHLEEWTSLASEDITTDRMKSASTTSGGLRNNRPVVAIGHSYGGNLAVELALRHPSLVSDLILVDGGYIDLQGTFPDFSSCLLALRPPSFAGLEYSELERIVRAEWAIEGAKEGRSTNQVESISPDRHDSLLLSVTSGGAEHSVRKISSYVPPGFWSEQGIQAVLQNFKSINLNTTTVSGCRPLSSKSETIGARGSISTPTSTSGDALNGTARADDSRAEAYSNIGTVFNCVQTVLSFQRYVLLLEDLWLKRPVEQFRALKNRTRTKTLGDPDLPIEEGKNGAIFTCDGQEDSFLDSDCENLKSVIFIPAGAPSPFSSNKDRDIRVAIEALMEASELSVHPCAPTPCGVLEFSLCGHNIPLQVPRELGDAIHTHLTVNSKGREGP